MKQQNSIREIYGNLRNGAHIHTESTEKYVTQIMWAKPK